MPGIGLDLPFPLWVPGADESAVAVVPADGRAQVQLVSGPGVAFPVWSPNGLDIAFRSSRTGQQEVWLVSREAIGGSWGEPTQLTDFGCTYPDWAPDGSGVLCETDEGIARPFKSAAPLACAAQTKSRHPD